MSPTAIKEEVFELNRTIANIVETNIAVSSGEGLQTIWEYPVEVGQSLVFRHEDHFAAYLYDSGESAVGSLVDIVIADASKQAVRPLLNQMRYAQVRGAATYFYAFTNEHYFNHLDITPGDVVIAGEGERVLIRGNVNATLVAASCYFILTCHRIRHTLFE